MIKHLSYLIIAILANSNAFGQSVGDIIKESTHHFTVTKEDSLTGEGAKFIKQKISESHFFLIGEQHNVSLIEHFVQVIIPILKKNNYNNYITEIGPIAAAELKDLKKQKQSIKEFNKRYFQYSKVAPFGFFSTREEDATLNQLSKFDINLLGIDFENYGSYLFLIDKIYHQTDKQKINSEQYKIIHDFIASEYDKGKDGYNPHLTENLINSQYLKSFLKRTNNHHNQLLIEKLLISLHINQEQTKGYWETRIDNMKKEFSTIYNCLKKEENNLPKIFFKFGAVHTARGTSYSGFQEIGNMVYELSKLNQTKSFAIVAFPRYIYDKKTGAIQDLIEKKDFEILQFTTFDKWTVIDLRNLLKLSIDNHIILSRDIISYIEKYDAILIPPATKYSEQNY